MKSICVTNGSARGFWKWLSRPMACLAMVACAVTSDARPLIELGDAPTAPTPPLTGDPAEPGLREEAVDAGLSVNILSREEVRNLYKAVYKGSANMAEGWTGDLKTCNAGSTDPGFQQKVLERIRFFRAMAGVPAAISLDDAHSAKNQQAALMMTVNNQLNHFPPTSWICYSADGAEAAKNSNIAIGSDGPDSVEAYINDFGSNNSVAGHRRWLLYPQTVKFGTGDVPRNGTNSPANSIWVFDGNFGRARPTTREDFVSWPPPGFTPHPLVYGRWSISHPTADFSGATVKVSTNGVNIPVTLETLANGYGENTLVWHPTSVDVTKDFDWPKPASDTPYLVEVKNVKGSGAPASFTYTVTVFDPDSNGADTVLPVISGPDQAAVGQSNGYTFTPVNLATGYQARMSEAAPLSAVNGAEAGAGDLTVSISPGYDAIATNPTASGTHSFHLAHPEPPIDQVLTSTRFILPKEGGQLRFQSRLGWADPAQVATVQVSLDEGRSWKDVYTQPGSGGRGEISFNLRTVSLGAFANQMIQVRFVYHIIAIGQFSFFPQTAEGVGWYIDDITYVNTEELINPVVKNIAAGSRFSVIPPKLGVFALDLRPQLYGVYYADWGPAKLISAINAAVPVVQILGNPQYAQDQVRINFKVTNFRSGLGLWLMAAPDLAGPWTLKEGATLQTVTPDTVFRLTTPNDGAAKSFYRVQAN